MKAIVKRCMSAPARTQILISMDGNAHVGWKEGVTGRVSEEMREEDQAQGGRRMECTVQKDKMQRETGWLKG